jgi:hypothetical protein
MRGSPGALTSRRLIVTAALISSLAAGGQSASTSGQRGVAAARPVVVRTTAAFHAALSAAGPGTTIAIAPGVYAGGAYRAGLAGTAAAPIVIRALDAASPPVFEGGPTGLQLSDARYVTLSDLTFRGARDNGINIDDGETFATPSAHIRISRVTVFDLREGNHDGIKLSGVTDFVIEEARIERWGAGGSAVDMIGCHRGVIRGSVFRHTPGIEFGNGIEAKGGSSAITISGNTFEHASSRAVQIGGSTGRQFFRPQPPAAAEARDVIVEDNVIIGSEAAVAFVGSDGGTVRFNTIYLPTKWPLRILQEQAGPGVTACRNGTFRDNIVYWRGDQTINVGDGTNAASFTFAHNWWFRADDPGRSRLSLPSVERDGIYGADPQFIAPPRNLRTRENIAFGVRGPRAPGRRPVDSRSPGV